MKKASVLALGFVLAVVGRIPASGQDPQLPDTVAIQSGGLILRGLLWTPRGSGPFPAVLFNHGSYGSTDTVTADEPAALGGVFARHGYAFLFLFRRGVGLSAGQGAPEGDLMDRAFAARGQEGRNRVQLELLEAAPRGRARSSTSSAMISTRRSGGSAPRASSSTASRPTSHGSGGRPVFGTPGAILCACTGRVTIGATRPGASNDRRATRDQGFEDALARVRPAGLLGGGAT